MKQKIELIERIVICVLAVILTCVNVLIVASWGRAELRYLSKRAKAETSQPEPLTSYDPADKGEETEDGTQSDASASSSSEGGVGAGAESEEMLKPEETLTPEEERTKQAEQILATMSTEERVYQLFIVAPEQLAGGQGIQTVDGLAESLKKYPVGGVILFENNLSSATQVQSLLSGIQKVYDETISPFLAVDEEGGKVARVANTLAGDESLNIQTFESAKSLAEPKEANKVAKNIGSYLSKLGFNYNLAPVADVFYNADNTTIGNRCFSDDPDVAAEFVSAYVSGLKSKDIMGSLKHFPGHGNAVGDSHTGGAVLDRSLAQLQECELKPFQAGIEAGAPSVMIGHISCPQLLESELNTTGENTNRPASLSYTVIHNLLREQMGYQGLVITDALNMQAVTNFYSAGDAALAAIEAGVDVLLMPADFWDASSAVLSRTNEDEVFRARVNESVLRILKAKLQYGIIEAPQAETEATV